jgi:CRISPR system Cascade subunit CasB
MRLHRFQAKCGLGEALNAWHAGLAESRGDRAELRRASTSLDAASVLASHRLINELRAVDDRVSIRRIPMIAAVLSHIRTADAEKYLPAQLAAARVGSDSPVFSQLRFRRLLQADDEEALAVALRRAIAQLGGKADIYSTAEGIYYWNDTVRKDWSFEYFGVTAARSKR